jgi:hypothetical protein
VFWITSWVPMCSLPWTQRKRWMPIRSMGCMYTHWKMFAIEGWGSPSRIRNVVEKIGEDNWKVGKIGQGVNQMFAPRLKHDKIWARWALNVPLENMLKMVWWCKCFKMDSWSWTICCPMSCSNGGKHAWACDGKKSHVALRCCWKGNVLFSTRVKALRRKGH